MCSKNNKFFLIIWILLTRKILYHIIVLQILCSLIIICIFIYNATKKKIIILNPNLNYSDSVIFKFISAWTNEDKKGLIRFIVFAYIIIFLIKTSLRSLYLSIKIYNEIKFQYYLTELNVYNLMLKLYQDELIKKRDESINIRFLNSEIKINL